MDTTKLKVGDRVELRWAPTLDGERKWYPGEVTDVSQGETLAGRGIVMTVVADEHKDLSPIEERRTARSLQTKSSVGYRSIGEPERPEVFLMKKEHGEGELELRIVRGYDGSWQHAFLSVVDEDGDCAVATFGDQLADWNVNELARFRGAINAHIEYLIECQR